VSGGAVAVRRAFLGVVPPPAVLDAIEQVVGGIASSDDGLRWTTRHQWHATLQFLGRVNDLDALAEAVRIAVASVGPPVARLGGGGAFPKVHRGSGLWIGFAVGNDALAAVATAIVSATAPLGYPAQDRDLRPHVTLARARRPRDLRSLVDALGDDEVGPEWSVPEVELVESETLPEGARYTTRARLPFAV
jgi:RNA 2',3'-cyclic 3'-phosphodiesterase